MSVHYKFKSSLDYDTVTFDGLHISVGDLKKAIIQQKKIGKSFDFDLQITNAQTKEVYSEDDALIPKNSSVIVARIPVTNTTKKTWDRGDSSSPLVAAKSSDSPSDGLSFDKIAKTADLTSINASEDDKIKAMMTQATQDYDPSKYQKVKGMTGPLPANYTCFRCGKQGHWIKNCPTNTFEVKRSTGIPRSFMVAVDGPEVPGALLTNTGHFAVPVIDHEAYKEGKKEKPPFTKEPSPEKVEKPVIPEELLCMICRDLLSDAVLIPCCGNSYCDECVRQALLDSEEHECPTCHEKDISPDTLIPNRFLRTAVMNFKNETGYTKIKRLIKPVVKSPSPPPPVMPASPEPVPPVHSSLSPHSSGPVLTESNSPWEPEPGISSSQLPMKPATEANSTSEELVADDRPDTPVCDEKPDSVHMAIPPHPFPPTAPIGVPVTCSIGGPVINTQTHHMPPTHLHPPFHPSSMPPESQKFEEKEGGYSIATITTRTQRHPFPPMHTSTIYSSKRSHAQSGTSHSRSGHPSSRAYSPKHDHHYSHHSSSSHGAFSQMPPVHSSVSVVPSHPNALSHMHRPPPPHLYPPPMSSGPHHPFPSNPVPPTRLMPPRGPLPPAYPPQPPPPGSIPLGPPPYDQPPPPGINRPIPPLGPQHHGNYDFYRDHKDRSKNALEDFERELMEYKFDRTRHNSRSTSRSYMSSRSSSRSRSHSISRSLTHSTRSHSRSRSYSYSRSRSSSISRSRTRSRSRSRSSYRRSRTRSRSRSRRYSPGYRRSRSRSPYARSRSPYRRGGYSPSYYNNEFNYQPQMNTFPIDQRNRFYPHHNYRGGFDDYHFGGEQRFDSQQEHQPPPQQHPNPRFEYPRYEDMYRGHSKNRSWTPDAREKERREQRKEKISELAKKEDHAPSPHTTNRDKENNEKKPQKRHKSKSRKEKDQEFRSGKDSKSTRESSSLQKHIADDYYHDSRTSEKSDMYLKGHGGKKSSRHYDPEPDSKSKEKKHRTKTRKPDQSRSRSKRDKNSAVSKEKEAPALQTPTTKVSSNRLQRFKPPRHGGVTDDGLMKREMNTHRVNPNIIVIKTDPELKMKHVIKEADSTDNIAVGMKHEEPQSSVSEPLQHVDVAKAPVKETEPDSVSEAPGADDRIETEEHLEETQDSAAVAEELKLETEADDLEEAEEEVDEEEVEEEQEDEEEEMDDLVLEIEEQESDSGEPVLTAQIPELSKWEREDSDMEESAAPEIENKGQPSPKSKGSKSLPPDIVERAEKAILHKLVKPTIVNTMSEASKSFPKLTEKKSKTHDKTSPKIKSLTANEVREIKTTDVATLQITISGRDKRCVEAKDSNPTRDKKEHGESKSSKNRIKEKVKLDRSKFHGKIPHDESSNGHRMMKMRPGRNKHSPDRNSHSPNRKELEVQDAGDLRLVDRHYGSSPKKERVFEARDRRARSYDREVYRNPRQDSSDRGSSSRMGDQQRRKEGQRHYKDPDDGRRRSSKETKREKAEKDRSGESLERRPPEANEREREKMRAERDRYDKRPNSKESQQKKPLKVREESSQDSHEDETKHLALGKGRGLERSALDGKSPTHPQQNNNRDGKGGEKYSFSKAAAGRDHLKQRDRRKSTIDESKFEPNYDMSSESENEANAKGEHFGAKRETSKTKRSSSLSPDRSLKKMKKEKLSAGEAEISLGALKATQLLKAKPAPSEMEDVEMKNINEESSSSSSSSESGSASPASVHGQPAMTLLARDKIEVALLPPPPTVETHPAKEKHKHKKSKHKKHKKHKHKHKKKKHKNKHKEEKEAKPKVGVMPKN